MEELVNSILQQQFSEVAQLVGAAHAQVYRVANSALIDLYWQIGRYISAKVESSEWGDNVVGQLADFIQRNIPQARGFSDKNLWRMKRFYETYRDADEKLSSLMRQISWTNNLKILSRCKTLEEREFYIKASVSERLSSRELDRQITTGAYERSHIDKPILSSVMRELVPAAEQTFRDRYVIEFLGGNSYPTEYSLKQAIIAKMKDFLLEIGKDFVFIGQEYRLQVGTEDFRIDLLFFHRELRCLVAFEVKLGRFHPSNLGQLEFYLEALDRDVRKPHENPSIGILLCKDKDDEVVEYAMARSQSPTLVAQYELMLPDKKMLRAKMRELFDNTEAEIDKPE